MKTLKLVGPRVYTGPRVGNEIIENGQTVNVTDENAAIMLQGQEWTKEGYAPHWEDVTGKKVEEEVPEAEQNDDPDVGGEGEGEGSGEEQKAPEQPKEPVSGKAKTQRRARSAS